MRLHAPEPHESESGGKNFSGNHHTTWEVGSQSGLNVRCLIIANLADTTLHWASHGAAPGAIVFESWPGAATPAGGELLVAPESCVVRTLV